MKYIKLILVFLLLAIIDICFILYDACIYLLVQIYYGLSVTACFVISATITLYAFGNTFSTPQLQVHFTWWSVVMMFVLAFGLCFLWLGVINERISRALIGTCLSKYFN